MNVKTLYRPVGIKELELIIVSSWKAFPPRLEWQPIFYPVLNQRYAEKIAKDWNTEDEFSGYCGIVTKFDVAKDHFEKYKVENVGDEMHNELWVPAEELDIFNQHIVGKIEVVKVFFGEKFIMPEGQFLQPIIQKFKQ
ncbi:MAG: ADP-ribosylation/crystallin J1 [Ferruginibacter sp.]